MAVVRIRSDAVKIISVNSLAFLFGAGLLFLLSCFRLLISLPMSLILMALLAFALSADVAIWFFRGVRAVQIDGKGLLLERGRLPEITRIRKDEIERIRIRKFPGRSLIVTLRIPGRKFIPFAGRYRRERIAEISFHREDFDRLAAAVNRLKG
jgi:hypothetical protein